MNHLLAPETSVQIFFKTGISVEGVVQSFTEKLLILKALQGPNNIMVFNPTENILMIKIIAKQTLAPPVGVPQSTEEKVKAKIKNHLEHVQEEKQQIAQRLGNRPSISEITQRYKNIWSK